jgi:hypothetical protein
MGMEFCPRCKHPTKVYRDQGNRPHFPGCSLDSTPPVHYTDPMTETDTSLETEARALFEADPSFNLEADWDNLAQYKRDGWMTMAETARLRKANNNG